MYYFFGQLILEEILVHDFYKFLEIHLTEVSDTYIFFLSSLMYVPHPHLQVNNSKAGFFPGKGLSVLLLLSQISNYFLL